MLDQLVVAKGVNCIVSGGSTFSGMIIRLRGYYGTYANTYLFNMNKEDRIQEWLDERANVNGWWSGQMEFPLAWDDIDMQAIA